MSWAYEKRRKARSPRDDWYILRREGLTMNSLVGRAVDEMSPIRGFPEILCKQKVRLRWSEHNYAYIVGVDEDPRSYLKPGKAKKPLFIIALRRDKKQGVVESLGHELGHLYAWLVLGSWQTNFYEEIFAVEFGREWSGLTENRIWARRCIADLLFHREKVLRLPS